ncbi:MAG TPA: GNAT family N-acetyltransferase [Clostridia bacterium]|nr:GNAT family N-acetyltransferase [Clostridia bacterium]
MNIPENKLAEIVSKIRCCEKAYIECFSERFEYESVIRYRNSRMSDMYDHNCSFIKGTPTLDALLQLVDGEIGVSRGEDLGFCKILLDGLRYETALKDHDDKLQTEHYGQYVFTPEKPPEWDLKTHCEIRKITEPLMVDDLVLLDRTMYAEACGQDFCERRARCRGQVYLSDSSIDSYICYCDGEPAGNCDLFLYDDMAKIEDFTVLPKYQRRGLGTSILKHLIGTAFSEGARIIYLTTDEEDTPKEMYMKLGFEKVSDSYALLRKL